MLASRSLTDPCYAGPGSRAWLATYSQLASMSWNSGTEIELSLASSGILSCTDTWCSWSSSMKMSNPHYSGNLISLWPDDVLLLLEVLVSLMDEFVQRCPHAYPLDETLQGQPTILSQDLHTWYATLIRRDGNGDVYHGRITAVKRPIVLGWFMAQIASCARLSTALELVDLVYKIHAVLHSITSNEPHKLYFEQSMNDTPNRIRHIVYALISCTNIE
jgi:hypothetical protein